MYKRGPQTTGFSYVFSPCTIKTQATDMCGCHLAGLYHYTNTNQVCSIRDSHSKICPQPLCLPNGTSCYRQFSTPPTCTIPCHGLYSGLKKFKSVDLLMSDLTKEYSNTSHTISPTTLGMEKMMEEYIAYKSGNTRDPEPNMKGAESVNICKNILQGGSRKTTCTW